MKKKNKKKPMPAPLSGDPPLTSISKPYLGQELGLDKGNPGHLFSLVPQPTSNQTQLAHP